MKNRREQLIERWENCLRVLQNLTPHQRRKHWSMGSFGRKTECGTVACAAGHCGLDPWFRRRGFKMDFYTNSKGWAVNTLAGNDDGKDIDIEGFFGKRGCNQILFDSHDRSVGKVIKEVKDHIKWLHTTNEGDWDHPYPVHYYEFNIEDC